MPKAPVNPDQPPKFDPCSNPTFITFRVNATTWVKGTNTSSACQSFAGAPFFPADLTYVGFGTWEYNQVISGVRWRIDLSFDCSMPHNAMLGTMLVQTDPPTIQSGYSCAASNLGEGTYLPDDACNDPAIVTVEQT